jgi:hypothetical protein
LITQPSEDSLKCFKENGSIQDHSHSSRPECEIDDATATFVLGQRLYKSVSKLSLQSEVIQANTDYIFKNHQFYPKLQAPWLDIKFFLAEKAHHVHYPIKISLKHNQEA